ncbi:MAG: diguanylate cyclase [Elusimicrobia bacterium]|nr:diguanylate cyclase [Elusimicrobiota bacterium]
MRPLNPIVKILLVEGNRDEAEILQDSFKEIQCTPILARSAETLTEALRIPAKTRIDLILLDLQLADSAGLETLKKMNIRFPKVPIVIFAESYDEKLAVKALHNGAQDYLIKSDVTIPLISRVIRYAIERQKLLSEVKALSLSDELTRLYNRRGFQILTEQQIKLSARRKKGACLIFADLDRLKAINDRFGHPEGDKALKDTWSHIRIPDPKQVPIVQRHEPTTLQTFFKYRRCPLRPQESNLPGQTFVPGRQIHVSTKTSPSHPTQKN